MEFPDARILVVCKAPVPGEVKTRLQEVLTPAEAAALHGEMARTKIKLIQDAGLAPMEIWCAPDTGHAFFTAFREAGCVLLSQSGADLGERMAGALRDCLENRASMAVLIGTDCPSLDARYLRTALTRLADHDAVIGPAEDGGYGLIGLRRFEPAFFEGIPWGTDRVCAETCKRFNEERLCWALLPLLWDVDRPADLTRYQRYVARD